MYILNWIWTFSVAIEDLQVFFYPDVIDYNILYLLVRQNWIKNKKNSQKIKTTKAIKYPVPYAAVNSIAIEDSPNNTGGKPGY